MTLFRAISLAVCTFGTGLAEFAIYRVPASNFNPNLNLDVIQYDAVTKDRFVLEQFPSYVLDSDLIVKTSDEVHTLAKNTFSSAGDGWYDSYHNAADIMAYYTTLFANMSSVSFESLGTTIGNQTIDMYTIPAMVQNGTSPRNDTLNVVLNCGIHAREWIAHASCQYFMEQYLQSADFLSIAERVNLYFVPINNIDGYLYTWECQNCTSDEDHNRMWRKNRNPNTDSSLNNTKDCYGIDLNRNYDAGWGGEGSSGDPCSNTYRGLGIESEIEAKVIADLVRDTKPVLFLDIHSYTQKILMPYGYTLDNITTRSTLENAGNAAAAEMLKIDNTVYSVGSSSQDLYINSGSSKDWAYDAGVAYSYTIELRDTGEYGFLLPPDQILPTAQELTVGLKSLMEAALATPDPIPDPTTTAPETTTGSNSTIAPETTTGFNSTIVPSSTEAPDTTTAQGSSIVHATNCGLVIVLFLYSLL